jgi:hypothetical protein
MNDIKETSFLSSEPEAPKLDLIDKLIVETTTTSLTSRFPSYVISNNSRS